MVSLPWKGYCIFCLFTRKIHYWTHLRKLMVDSLRALSLKRSLTVWLFLELWQKLVDNEWPEMKMNLCFTCQLQVWDEEFSNNKRGHRNWRKIRPRVPCKDEGVPLAGNTGFKTGWFWNMKILLKKLLFYSKLFNFGVKICIFMSIQECNLTFHTVLEIASS